MHATVLATVRPAQPVASGRSDLDRGLELIELFEAAGLELLDWFVIGPDGASSLREGTGLPLLWRGGADGGSACRAGPAFRRRQPQAGGPQPP